MNSKFAVVFLVSLLLCFGLAQGQTGPLLYLDHTDGATGNVLNAAGATFYIRIVGDATAHGGITNGFRIYSPEDAVWTTTVADTLPVVPGWKSMFDLVFSINRFSCDGTGIDTVGFGGAKLFSTGLPANFNKVSYTLKVGPFDASDAGKTLVLDSSYYLPSGTWMWAGPTVKPAWGGPYTFYIINEPAPPCSLDVTPTSLAFNMTEGGSFPTTQNISVSAVDVSCVPTFTATSNVNWLTLTGASGTTPANITVGVNPATAPTAPGHYEGLITITSPDVENSPQTVAVVFDVIAAAKYLAVTPTTLNFSAIEGEANPVPQTFAVTETGGFAIAYTASETSDWITLTNASGTTPGVVTVNVQTTGLTPGDYSYDVMVSSVLAGNSPVFVKVNLTVLEAPKYLAVAPSALYFSAVAGGTALPQTLTITETTDLSVGFTVAKNTAWLVLSDAAGTTPFDLGVGVDVMGLTPGYYFDTITISSQEVANSPVRVVVRLEVTAAPEFVVNPDSLVFLAVEGSNDTLSAIQTFNVSMTDGSEHEYTVFTNAEWIQIVSGAGGFTPADVSVQAYTVGLAAGLYLDSIGVTDVAFTKAAATVYVKVYLYVSEAPNEPPIILTEIAPYYEITECDSLNLAFDAMDPDGGIINMSVAPLADNMTFFYAPEGNYGTGYFTFKPDFSQGGEYSLVLRVSDGEDTVAAYFQVLVADCEPGTEGDTVRVYTEPAVPGAQVMIQVDIANICELWGASAHLGWTSEYLTLDSAGWADSRVADVFYSEQVIIDNDNNNALIMFLWTEAERLIPGSGNLVNLYFSLDVNTPSGFYPIDLYNLSQDPLGNPWFERDCGAGIEVVRPYFIPGGIVVDTTANYVCGYVVDPDGNPIPGATVELWSDFPGGYIDASTLSSGNGVFAFSDFTIVPFDLYAYKEGYYPGKVENINFGQSGIMIVLTPYAPIAATNTNVRFYCDENTYHGYPLPVGSVIDVYDPDGVRCGNYFVTEAGKYGFLYVYGEDIYTPGDQGAEPGNVLRFYVNGVEAITSAPAIWTQDLDAFEVCLDVPNVMPHTCTLNDGWNLISWNVDTEDDDVTSVLSSLGDCLEVVMGFEQGALTYDPALPMFSDLWFVDHLSGYWVKVKDGCGPIDLEVVGMPVPTSTPIPLTAGWNLVSYLPDYSLPTAEALASLNGDLIVALGYDGGALTYLPGDMIHSDLTEMGSCFGYWLLVNNDGQLVYPSENPILVAQSVDGNTAKTATFRDFKVTTSWMNLYAYELTINGTPVAAGSEIAAYTVDGLKVGSYTMKENGLFGFMPVYGDDRNTSEVDGLKSGQAFYLTVDGIKTEETFVFNGPATKLEISSLTSLATDNDDNVPGSFALAQNYPNPFNPSTTILFSLPTAGKAKIEVFNMLGELVATPFEGTAQAGENQVVWDGRSFSGQPVASGIYFYRLTADKYTETRKMTLVK